MRVGCVSPRSPHTHPIRSARCARPRLRAYVGIHHGEYRRRYIIQLGSVGMWFLVGAICRQGKQIRPRRIGCLPGNRRPESEGARTGSLRGTSARRAAKSEIRFSLPRIDRVFFFSLSIFHYEKRDNVRRENRYAIRGRVNESPPRDLTVYSSCR